MYRREVFQKPAERKTAKTLAAIAEDPDWQGTFLLKDNLPRDKKTLKTLYEQRALMIHFLLILS